MRATSSPCLGRAPARSRHHVVAPQRLADLSRNEPKQLVACDEAQRVVDSAEVVEVDVQHGQLVLVVPGLVHSLLEVRDEAGSAGQARQQIEIGHLGGAARGSGAFLAECQRELPYFVGMKRLLQVEQLVGRRDAPADLGRVDVGVCSADDDLDQRVDLTDALRGPRAVGPGRHPHVEEGHGDRLARGARLAHRVDGGFSAVAHDRVEGA